MTLDEVAKNLDTLSDELVIFQKHAIDRHSEVILREPNDDDGLILTIGDDKYYYLIEIFIAKEALEGWLARLDHVPTDAETADRIFEYGNNDA